MRLTAKPSILSSHTKSKSASSSSPFTRLYQASNCSWLKALAKLSMGSRCWTWEKPSAGAAPTRWVGESVVTNSECNSSNPRSSTISRSYSLSGTVGSSRT